MNIIKLQRKIKLARELTLACGREFTVNDIAIHANDVTEVRCRSDEEREIVQNYMAAKLRAEGLREVVSEELEQYMDSVYGVASRITPKTLN